MKSFIILFTYIALTAQSLAHGHHGHDKDELLQAYRDLFQSLEVSSPLKGKPIDNEIQKVVIKVGESSFSLPETVVADLVKTQLEAYEETIREYCECDITELKKENKKRLPSMIKKVVTFLPEIGHILSDMLWTEVAGFKRYGITYIIVSTIGEIIDHNISPVPLCKFIAFLSRAISDKIKTTGTLLWPFDTNIGPSTKIKALYSRIKYRRMYKTKWETTLFHAANTLNEEDKKSLTFWQTIESKMRKLEPGYLALQKFPKAFKGSNKSLEQVDLLSEVDVALKTLSPMEKMWYTDRLMEYYNFTYLLLLENGKILKKKHKMSKSNYFKLQWNIGNYGAKIDKLKILLYAASGTKDQKKISKLNEKIQKHIGELHSEYAQYQDLFSNVDENWKPYSKIKFSKTEKNLEGKEKSKCFKLMGKVFNFKTAFWSSVAFGTYQFISSEGTTKGHW